VKSTEISSPILTLIEKKLEPLRPMILSETEPSPADAWDGLETHTRRAHQPEGVGSNRSSEIVDHASRRPFRTASCGIKPLGPLPTTDEHAGKGHFGITNQSSDIKPECWRPS